MKKSIVGFFAILFFLATVPNVFCLASYTVIQKTWIYDHHGPGVTQGEWKKVKSEETTTGYKDSFQCKSGNKSECEVWSWRTERIIYNQAGGIVWPTEEELEPWENHPDYGLNLIEEQAVLDNVTLPPFDEIIFEMEVYWEIP